MRPRFVSGALLALLCVPGAAQVFDAATIKPSPPLDASNGPLQFGPRGGPGTADPGRYWCNFCSVPELVAQAYDIPEYRIFGASTLPAGRFHIVATVPANATREQLRAMLRSLLADRFKLAARTEPRELQSYRLIVSAGGAKLTAHVERTLSDEDARREREATAKRPPGVYYKVQGKTLAEFARVVEGQLRKPVADATGLAGQYDFDLYWTSDMSATEPTDAPTIYAAVQSLGLKLESRKQTLDVLVIDHVEKLPTEN